MIKYLGKSCEKSLFKIAIKTVMLLVTSLAMLSSCTHDKKDKFKILVIHSDNVDYHPYERYNKSFAKAVKAENVSAEIEYFYLYCDKYNSEDEIKRLDSVVNSYRGHKLDLIVVNGDQATYSLLSTYNPLLKKIPVVFGAVRYPNWKLLSKYAPYGNVTGLHDSMDVVKNMEFAKDVTNRGCIITQIDDSYIDRQTSAFVNNQLAEHPNIVNNMQWKYPLNYIRRLDNNTLSITSVSLRHSERMASEEEVTWRRKDRSVPTCGDDADKKMIGSQNYFFMMSKYSDGFCYLALKNESGSRLSVGIYSNFVFTAIDESFDMGEKSKIIGGYFTTWETTAAEEAKILKKILVDNVKPCDIPIYVPKKEYVVDWNTHNNKMDIEMFKKLPSYVSIRNMPFKERHPMAYFSLIYGTVAIVIFLLVYYYVLFKREHKKKRRAYEHLMEEKENVKLALMESKTYAWVIKNGKATINKNFFEDMKIPSRAWLVDQKHDLWFVLPKYRDDFRNFIEVQKKKGRHTFQFESNFGNGETRWWEVRSTTLTDNKGRNYIVGLLIDIRDIKQHEKELEKARKKAVEGERLAEEARKLSKEAELKQSFLANMSHEIRTPLNAIVGFSTLIADESDSLSNEDKKMFVKDINRNTTLLLRLINDVLDIARIESGNIEFDFNKVSVNTVLDDTYNATRLQMPKYLKYMEVKCIDNPLINVDEGRLQQVLSNFVTNAGKFTPSGSVTLGCRYDEKAREVEMYVEDTGIGLTPAEQKVVFDRFYKSDKYRQGTGLGLAISKVIVNRLKGRIELKSEKGKGSRFSVILSTCTAEE